MATSAARKPKLEVIEGGRQTVTGEIARRWLERNVENRPISRREIDRLKRVLVAKKWRYNGEAVKFDKRGRLRDGQHRLTAIAETDVPAELLVVTDLGDEAFKTLDQGRKRTGGDVLHIRGIKRYNAASVACATLYRVLKNRAIYGAVDTIPAYGIDDILDRHPGLARSLEYCAPIHGHGDTGVIGLGYLAAFHYIMETLYDEPAKAASFVEGVAQGTGLKPTSPILQFRRRVLSTGKRRDVMHAQAKTALIAKVAGLHLSGQTAKYLTQPPTAATYQTLMPGLTEMVEQMGAKDRFDDLTY